MKASLRGQIARIHLNEAYKRPFSVGRASSGDLCDVSRIEFWMRCMSKTSNRHSSYTALTYSKSKCNAGSSPVSILIRLSLIPLES